MKKKLENAYIPDKQTRKEKVLVGLSGGIDSYVTAYLLKIQKYDVIGATVMNSWENWDKNPSNILSCHIDQTKLEAIKDFCQRLNIPLYVIKSSQEFKEEVIEGWTADRISGKLPNQCWNCHELRMRLLNEKKNEIQANFLATGHFAKLFHPDNNSVFVHTSNDEENDQSALLSRLPHDILKNLILPLSDLMKKEVLKLAQNFGLADEKKNLEIHQCLTWSPEIKEIVQKLIPGKLIAGGEILSTDGHSFGQHEGVIDHLYGESFDYKDIGKVVKGYFAEYSHQDKKMLVEPESFFTRKDLLLSECHYAEGTSWPEPTRGYAVISHDSVVECWIHPKSLYGAYIELIEPAFVKEGTIISVLKKKGKNSKLYLTGKINFLPVEPIVEEGEQSVPKADRSRDY